MYGGRVRKCRSYFRPAKLKSIDRTEDECSDSRSPGVASSSFDGICQDIDSSRAVDVGAEDTAAAAADESVKRDADEEIEIAAAAAVWSEDLERTILLDDECASNEDLSPSRTAEHLLHGRGRSRTRSCGSGCSSNEELQTTSIIPAREQDGDSDARGDERPRAWYLPSTHLFWLADQAEKVFGTPAENGSAGAGRSVYNYNAAGSYGERSPRYAGPDFELFAPTCESCGKYMSAEHYWPSSARIFSPDSAAAASSPATTETTATTTSSQSSIEGAVADELEAKPNKAKAAEDEGQKYSYRCLCSVKCAETNGAEQDGALVDVESLRPRTELLSFQVTRKHPSWQEDEAVETLSYVLVWPKPKDTDSSRSRNPGDGDPRDQSQSDASASNRPHADHSDTDIHSTSTIEGRNMINTRNKHPLLLFLSGYGSINWAAPGAAFLSGLEYVLPHCEDYFLLLPLAADRYWDSDLVYTENSYGHARWCEESVETVLKHCVRHVEHQIQSRMCVDFQRMYVTGISTGGTGCWSLLGRCGRFFAGAVPVVGNPDWGYSGKRLWWDYDGAEKRWRRLAAKLKLKMLRLGACTSSSEDVVEAVSSSSELIFLKSSASGSNENEDAHGHNDRPRHYDENWAHARIFQLNVKGDRRICAPQIPFVDRDLWHLARLREHEQAVAPGTTNISDPDDPAGAGVLEQQVAVTDAERSLPGLRPGTTLKVWKRSFEASGSVYLEVQEVMDDWEEDWSQDTHCVWFRAYKHAEWGVWDFLKDAVLPPEKGRRNREELLGQAEGRGGCSYVLHD
eukprot:g5271.t1